jgi:hypothetical protein
MKTNLMRTILPGSILALALAVGTVCTQAAEPVKGAEKLMMKPIKTSGDVDKLESGDMVAMSCPKCKTIAVTYVDPTVKGQIKDGATKAKHLCPGCETTIHTEGRGKQATDKVTHVCKTCGSEDAFCCVLKKGTGPTKGMEKK